MMVRTPNIGLDLPDGLDEDGDFFLLSRA